MADYLSAFERIAPFLTQPLVLIGFVLMLVFSIPKQLLKAGIIPKLDKQQGGRIVELSLRYGFLLGLVMMLLGFGWKFYETYTNKEVKISTQAIETVTALSKGQGIDASQSELKAALAALAQGNTTLAKSLFAETVEKAEQHVKQG